LFFLTCDSATRTIRKSLSDILTRQVKYWPKASFIMQLNRLIIIGAGAVGGSVGGLVMQSDFSVEFVTRGEHGHKIRNDGLTIHQPQHQLTVHPPCFETMDEVAWRVGDMVIVATKLQDAKQVMDQLVGLGITDVPVVCASNGMHGEQWARQRFKTALSMLVWMPATYLVPGEVSVHSEFPGVLDTGPVHHGSEQELAFAKELCSRSRAVSIRQARHCTV